MKVIDFEAHYYTQELLDEFYRRNEPPYIDENDVLFYTGVDGHVHLHLIGGKDCIELLDMAEFRLKEMDEAGTDVQILSAAQGIEMLPPEIGVRIAHNANKSVFETMKKYPGRFQGMAALPLSDVEASLKELEVCFEEYGFVGATMFSYLGNNKYPDDEEFEPIYAKINEYNKFVYLHPAYAGMDRLHGLGPQMLCAAVGFGIDTMIAYSRIIARGIFDRYPDLKLFMGHFGETVPFIYERFDNLSIDDSYDADYRAPAVNKFKAGHYIDRNLYVTSSGMTSKAAFECTKSVLGIDKILFGSDYPMEHPHGKAKEYIDSLPVSKEEREQIFYKNAERICGIEF